MNTLYIVVPLYNEEEILIETSNILIDVLDNLRDKISEKSRILFVDDGSLDKSWDILKKLCKDEKISALRFSKNFGQQCAIFAGLSEAKKTADMVITIDADLQDDVLKIEEMVDKYYSGFQIVCGVRNSRKSDTFFKRFTAQLYYKILKKTGKDIIYDHAEFRLMSKMAIEKLIEISSDNLFIRGAVNKLGFPVSKVFYERKKRLGGKSKSTITKMIKLAFDGIKSYKTDKKNKPYYEIMEKIL